MARKPLDRKVCFMPLFKEFYAKGEVEHKNISLTLEEYETIRLIDYIGLSQEQCASHMKIARTTVQKIYSDARKKLSTFLVEGQPLSVAGGNYQVCPHHKCHICENYELYNKIKERGKN